MIYSWRGSMFNIFYKFRELYHAEELSLPVNYRSSQTILAVSRRFQESGDSLTVLQEEGEKISVKNHYDPFQKQNIWQKRSLLFMKEAFHLRRSQCFTGFRASQRSFQKFWKNIRSHMKSLRRKSFRIFRFLLSFYILRFLSNHEDLTSGTYVLCDKTFGEGWTSKKSPDRDSEFYTREVNSSKSLLFQAMWEYWDTGSGYIICGTVWKNIPPTVFQRL